MIRLVVLDAYGITILGGYPDTCKFLAKKYNRNWKEIYGIFYKKYFNMAAEKKITQGQAWEKSLKECGIPLSVKEVKKIHYSLMRLNMDVVRFAKKLDCNVVLLSKNTRSQFHDNCEMFKLKKHFRYAINTWELGLKKASKETCEYMLERFNVRPSEIIWTDDQQENLIEPERLGIKTVHYKNFKQFKNDLEMLIFVPKL